MPELPQKKVGIIACSGEELAEGTVSRLAALRVLEQLRPGETVTICLPLFLAGGEADRAFAKFYPTIAIDGCEKRCAYRGTEKYSNKPAGSIVVSDLVRELELEKPEGSRKLNRAGMQVVDAVAEQAAMRVDQLIGKTWNRSAGQFNQPEASEETHESVTATCSCGSGIPIQTLIVAGKEITLIALPLIFQNFLDNKKGPSETVMVELMEMVKIYNYIEPPDEPGLTQAIMKAYQIFCREKGANHG
ncbi:MAG: putative zinc-binding protein [Anaerolineae bacterium]|nr:putative zinc-binding protein [Anaerolineae bacterium]